MARVFVVVGRRGVLRVRVGRIGWGGLLLPVGCRRPWLDDVFTGTMWDVDTLLRDHKYLPIIMIIRSHFFSV